MAQGEQQLLVFTTDGHRFAIDLTDVDRVVSACSLAEIPGAPPTILGLLNLHGQPIPVVSLRRKLKLTERNLGLTDEIIIIKRNGQIMGVAVDDVEGVSAARDVNKFDSSADCNHICAASQVELGIVLVHHTENLLSADEKDFLAGGGES